MQKMQKTSDYLDILNKKLEEDISSLDYENLEPYLIRLPNKISVWNKLLSAKIRDLDDIEISIQEKYKELYKYYKFEFDLTLDKSEIKFFINGDTEYTSLLKKKNKVKNIINFCENSIKILNDSSWSIKHLIDYRKMIQGS